MKRLLLFLCCSGAMLCAADLETAKTVYILSMSRGLDQYLANRLAAEHLLTVVTDPKKADVILTDQYGERLQEKLDSLAPKPETKKSEVPPPPGAPKPAAEAAKPVAEATKPAADAKTAEEAKSAAEAKPAEAKAPDAKPAEGKPGPQGAGPSPFVAEPQNKLATPGSLTSFGGRKGVVFLVDAKSSEVLWSTFEVPKSTQAKDMDRTASDIVSRLKHDMKRK